VSSGALLLNRNICPSCREERRFRLKDGELRCETCSTPFLSLVILPPAPDVERVRPCSNCYRRAASANSSYCVGCQWNRPVVPVADSERPRLLVEPIRYVLTEALNREIVIAGRALTQIAWNTPQ
jgi:hypothetical protein